MSSKDWDIQILQKWGDIWRPSFLSSWENLMERSADAHVFFHPVLVKVWVDTYLPLQDFKPFFVHAHCGNQEVIFPLVLWSRNWKNGFLRVLVPAGYSDFDYHDPLFLQTPSRKEVIEFYEALLLELDKLCTYDRICLDGLHAHYLPQFGRIVNQEECVSWQLDHRLDSLELVLPPKKKLASDIKRRLRRFKEKGTVTFNRMTAKDKYSLSQSIEKMLVCHSLRWPNAYKAPQFHQKLIDAGIGAGLLDFVTVLFGGKPVAWRVSFIYKQVISFYMPAFDNEFQKYSLGYVTMGYALQGASLNGITTVDHLRGEEDYKRVWGGETTTIHDVVFDKKDFGSLVRLSAHNAMRKVKRRQSDLPLWHSLEKRK